MQSRAIADEPLTEWSWTQSVSPNGVISWLQAEKPTTEESVIKWTNADGSINWPVNDGFLNKPKNIILQTGKRIDRYGNPTGRFTSLVGTPYSARALFPGTYNSPYNVYEVVKPVNVLSGKVAPWFDEVGGGTQYMFFDSIENLINQGILRKVN